MKTFKDSVTKVINESQIKKDFFDLASLFSEKEDVKLMGEHLSNMDSKKSSTVHKQNIALEKTLSKINRDL